MSATAVRLMLLVALCVALTSPTRANQVEDQFAAAAEHYSAKRWDLAADEFRAFVRENPGHAKRGKAMFFEGESLVQLGRHADAYPVFVDLLAEQPTGPYAKQALYRAAEAAVISGKNAEAEVRLSQFQSQYPADRLNANILMFRGQLALHSGGASSSERWYREALEKFPDATCADECRLRLAHVLEVEKRPDDAARLIREVADHDHSPWSEMALIQLGARELAANHPQAALEHYEAVEKRFPHSPMLPQTHMGCGRALYQMGHYAEAQTVLGSLVSNHELASDARYWIGQAQKAENERKAKDSARAPAAESIKANSKSAAANQPTISSRRDPKSAVAAAPAPSEPPAAEPTAGSIATSENKTQISSVTIKSPTPAPATDDPAVDKTVIDSTPRTSADPKAASIHPVPADVVAQRDEQNRRRSAAIRYQAADAMIRAKDYGRAISTLQMGDISGDDPRSLGNRYLLAIALQGAGRNEEALKTLDDLSRALEAKLAAATASEPSDANGQTVPAISKTDLDALHSLNDNVQLAVATSLVARQQYADAIKPLQVYLATSRKDLGGERSRSALAICLAHVHRADEANRVLAQLIEIYPSSSLIPSTTHQVAEAAYTAGEYSVAAELFSKLAADDNSSDLIAKGLAGLGWCHYQAGENDAADHAFAEFLERFPTDQRSADVALARGQVLERLGKDEPALAVVRLALKRYPQAKQLPQLLLAAARLCDRLQQDDEAVLLYQRVLREFPKHPEIDAVQYGLAWSLRDLGRGDDSEKTFRRLNQEHPESRYWADATYRLAERAAQRGERDVANGLLETVVDGDGPVAVREHALYLMAQIAIGAEKWTAAEPHLARMLHDFPEGSLGLQAEFWLAEVAYRRGDHPLAQQRFDALGSHNKDHREAWTAIIPLRRAQILVQEKQWAKAQAMAESIAPEYPTFDQQFEADYLIGRCLAAQANYEQARAAYMRVVRSATGGRTETAAMAQWAVGESYFHQDDYGAALREYLRVELVYPYSRWQAAALLQAAKCYERLEQPKEAAELYARVLQSYPQTEFVAEASKRLMETTRK